MTDDLDPDVVGLLKKGRKIEAIKKLREIRNIGLQEAKEIVDAYTETSTDPDIGIHKTKSSNGWILLLVLGGIGYLIYRTLG